MVETYINRVNPLTWNVPIANPKDGTPTVEFQKKWDQQAAANAAIPNLTKAAAISQLLDLIGMTEGDVLVRGPTGWQVVAPGTAGYVFKSQGAGAIPEWDSISDVLDTIGNTRGSIIFRGATGWTIRAPGTSGYVLTSNGAGADPTYQAAGGGNLIIGSGAPAAFEAAGTMYSRSDEARDYSSQPTSSPGGIVQHKSFIEPSSTPGSVTLTSAPTAGNLILAFISWGNSFTAQPTVNTAHWTQFITISATGVAGFALYRYVQPGDTSALPAFCTAGTDYWAAAVCEIDGMSGVFATDVPLSEGAYVQGATSQTSASQNTTANNQLAILAGGSYDASLGPTFSAGWTTDESGGNNTNFGSNGLAHQAVPTSGTAITGTNTFGGFVSTTSTLFQVIVAPAGILSAAWDELPLVDGTTIVRSSAGVLSAVASGPSLAEVLATRTIGF